jgi:tetratricopeptide (TPR) repeat protein
MHSALARAGRTGPRFRDAAPADAGRAVAAIKAALADLEQGRSEEALARLGQLRPIEVDSAPACALAGLICASAAAHRQALAWLDRALVLGPPEPALLGHRAHALAAIGDGNQALASYEAAAEAGSADPQLHFNRANLLRTAGRLEEAIAAYDTALRLKPAFPEALRAGGTVLRDLGHTEGALRFLGESLRLKPDDPDAWLDRTNLLQSLHRYGEALADYDRALAHLPGNAQLLTNRGIALIELGRLEEACSSFETALERDSALPQAHLNRGNVLVWLGRPDEALASFECALVLKPRYPEAACGRGLAQKLLGRYDEAMASYELALAEDPDFAYARANRGELNLLRGDFGRGWPDYEFRFLAGRQERLVLKGKVPFWTGEPCAGKRLAVFADQGNGDKIQFARFLPMLAATGADITVICPARLQKLFAPVTIGLHVVEAVDDDELFDLQVGLSSLPFCFRTTPGGIPAAQGYLKADPVLAARWAERLGREGLKIGLCWRGNQNWQVDPRRSLPLSAFAPLAAVPDVRLISLQLPDPTDPAAETIAALGVEQLGPDLDAGPHAFADTAAVIANLDLVVTCDTSIAHLAGALGRAVWVLIQASPEWRWMLESDESPWYSSMRLFRQQRRGDWEEPMGLLARAVGQWAEAWRAHRAATRAKPATVSIPAAIGEVVDKLTILRIKAERMRDPGKRANVRRELEVVQQALREALPEADPRIGRLAEELAEVNRTLWTVEDDIRDCERRGDFGLDFIALARSVYLTNDRRAALKRQINVAAGSQFLEEKEYLGG